MHEIYEHMNKYHDIQTMCDVEVMLEMGRIKKMASNNVNRPFYYLVLFSSLGLRRRLLLLLALYFRVRFHLGSLCLIIPRFDFGFGCRSHHGQMFPLS